MYISKEEAKKLIDNAPGKIWVDSFNGITFIHTKPRQISKTEGCSLVSQSETINYQDNDFFGLLSLEGIQEIMIHNIRFPSHCKMTRKTDTP